MGSKRGQPASRELMEPNPGQPTAAPARRGPRSERLRQAARHVDYRSGADLLAPPPQGRASATRRRPTGTQQDLLDELRRRDSEGSRLDLLDRMEQELRDAYDDRTIMLTQLRTYLPALGVMKRRAEAEAKARESGFQAALELLQPEGLRGLGFSNDVRAAVIAHTTLSQDPRALPYVKLARAERVGALVATAATSASEGATASMRTDQGLAARLTALTPVLTPMALSRLAAGPAASRWVQVQSSSCLGDEGEVLESLFLATPARFVGVLDAAFGQALRARADEFIALAVGLARPGELGRFSDAEDAAWRKLRSTARELGLEQRLLQEVLAVEAQAFWDVFTAGAKNIRVGRAGEPTSLDTVISHAAWAMDASRWVGPAAWTGASAATILGQLACDWKQLRDAVFQRGQGTVDTGQVMAAGLMDFLLGTGSRFLQVVRRQQYDPERGRNWNSAATLMLCARREE